MNLVDVLNSIWSQILEIASLFIIPDWGGIIGLLPVLIVLGLVAPFLTLPGPRDRHLSGSQAAGQGPFRGGPAGRRGRPRQRTRLPGRLAVLPS